MCTHNIILHQGKVADAGSVTELGQKRGGGFLSLSLSTKGWSNSLLKQLAALDWIDKVSLISTEEVVVKLGVFTDQSTVQDVLRWAREQGLLINGYQWREPSLEEIFLTVVGVER